MPSLETRKENLLALPEPMPPFLCSLRIGQPTLAAGLVKPGTDPRLKKLSPLSHAQGIQGIVVCRVTPSTDRGQTESDGAHSLKAAGRAIESSDRLETTQQPVRYLPLV